MSRDSIAALRRLVAEDVADHNALIPREQLGGRTPDETYAGIELQSLVPAQKAARPRPGRGEPKGPLRQLPAEISEHRACSMTDSLERLVRGAGRK